MEEFDGDGELHDVALSQDGLCRPPERPVRIKEELRRSALAATWWIVSGLPLQ